VLKDRLAADFLRTNIIFPIDETNIHCCRIVQTVLIVIFFVQVTFLLFSGLALFRKGIQWMLGRFKAEKS